jgi:nitrogen fixation protein FixH
MKINWGVKAFLFYTSFIVFIIFLVSLTMREKIELVTENYYEKDAEYQQRANEAKNFEAISGQVKFLVRNDSVILQFTNPNDQPFSTVVTNFQRPSDSTLDLDTSFSSVINQVSLPIGLFKKGMYRLKIRMEHPSNNFFKEQVLVIP